MIQKRKMGVVILASLLVATPIMASEKSLVYHDQTFAEIDSITHQKITYLGIKKLGKITNLFTEYFPEKNIVLTSNGLNKTVELNIRTGKTVVNDALVESVPFLVEQGATYLPVYFICEQFGFNAVLDQGAILFYKNGEQVIIPTEFPEPVSEVVIPVAEKESVTSVREEISIGH
ncbi:hypothetical protein [Clostridium sp.]|uniref:hypothetical protein n=1 Tax=Clostridium sp. TaxID=1506 RepID=UPI003F3F75F4